MLKLAFLNLFRRKSRTFLAVVGIVIGITALIALNAVVDGIYNEIDTVIGSFQAIMVMEKGSMDQTLSKLDESLRAKIESIQGVRVVVPEVWILPQTVGGKTLALSQSLIPPTIYGVDISAYRKLRGNGWIGELEKGEMLNSNDKYAVLMGKSLADDMHKFIGSSIKLNGQKFRVKGIVSSESELLGNLIIMDIDTAREIGGFPKDKVSSFYVEVIDPTEDRKVAKKINFALGSEVEANTASDFSEMFAGVMENFRLAALAIALISAFVAAIGIINTILMSVMERYREIGTLKATGWTNTNIMQMILYESTFIGIIGGIIGILFGTALSLYIPAFGIPTLIKLEPVLYAFLFAFFVGVVAGLYPAYRASKLDPVEAMRGA